jgi:uncharacterized membrane protein SpoIIM required for sporulation
VQCWGVREFSFVGKRRTGWERLEALVDRAERRGVRRLGADELEELAFLYRSATGDLATAQGRHYSATLAAYLNRLVARAHAYVYAGSARAGWSRIGTFFASGFPREVRRSWRPIAVCTTIFVLSAVIAYATVSARPATAYALLPGAEIPLVRKSLHDSNFAFDHTFAPAMSAAIITNNIQVAALAFAGGMTLGVFTVWEILTNGLMLGGLGALFASKGFGLDFWATVAPHGVIELTSIQIAGGAGLLIASAIVMPGRLRRIDALKRNARRAATLLLGVAALLVVAGTIEGFFSPLHTAPTVRLAVGAVTAVLLAAYLAFAGAGQSRPRAFRSR